MARISPPKIPAPKPQPVKQARLKIPIIAARPERLMTRIPFERMGGNIGAAARVRMPKRNGRY